MILFYKTMLNCSIMLIIMLIFLIAISSVNVAAFALILHWHPTNTNLPFNTQTLAVDDAAALYAGTWGSGIYLSTDHGATWLTATAGLTLPMYIKGGLAVSPVTPTVLFAGDYFGTLSGVGVYRSTNGGISWTVSLRDVGVETLRGHPLTLM